MKPDYFEIKSDSSLQPTKLAEGVAILKKKPDRAWVKARIVARLLLQAESGTIRPSRFFLAKKLRKTVSPRLVEQALNGR